MATFKIRYNNRTEEDVEATSYRDEKSFIDFYAEPEDGIGAAVRVLRVKSAAVARIETI